MRIMPNTPVEFGAGVICASESSAGDSDTRDIAVHLLGKLGTVEWVPEAQMEVATAIGGCAPAFYALFAERLTNAAVARGMDPGQAARVAGDTLFGAGRILREREYDAAAVQSEVASPGGLTERALASFDANGLADIVDRAVDAVLGKE